MSEERSAATLGATALPASVGVELHALARDLGDFRRTLVTADPIKDGLPTKVSRKS